MRSLTILAGAGMSLAIGTAVARAQDVTVYGGVTVTSNYVFRGVTFSDDGPAVQPYVEVEVNGFYAGIWGSNVDFGPGGTDDFEVDYYIGYRGETQGGFSYDLNYTRFTFDDTGDCCGEFNVVLGYPIHEKVDLSAVFAYDPDAETLASAIGAAYAINDKVSVSGSYGYDEALSHNYWDFGVNYALNDTTALDLRYYETDDTDALLVASVSVEFTLFGR